MSHLTTIKGKIKDAATLSRAFKRIIQDKRLAELFCNPAYVERYNLSGGQVTGYAVNLPDWAKAVVFDTATADVHFDNWGGRWGEISDLHNYQDRLLNQYELQVLIDTAAEQGHDLSYQQAADESIQFQIQVAG